MSSPIHVLFWRHAEADDVVADPGSAADMQRQLTRQGRRDASRVAAWIKARVPKPWVICASPALRAQQTAAALTDYAITDPRLGPAHSIDEMLELVAERADPHAALVLCGHQPTLGAAALRWLTGVDAPFTLRKSGLLWLAERERDGKAARALRACISGDLLD